MDDYQWSNSERFVCQSIDWRNNRNSVGCHYRQYSDYRASNAAGSITTTVDIDVQDEAPSSIVPGRHTFTKNSCWSNSNLHRRYQQFDDHQRSNSEWFVSHTLTGEIGTPLDHYFDSNSDYRGK